MPTSTIALWKKIAFAGIVCIVFFAGIELVLWLAGVQSVLQREDPSRGFSNLVSVYRRQGSLYQTRPTEGYKTFNTQSFLVDKPDNGLRIFCLGGSSAYGFPWDARASFSGVLQDVLAEAYPERTVECINSAGMSYAMHRLTMVAEEVMQYDPDLLIIYSGHNEFIEPEFFEELKNRKELRNQLDHLLAQSRIFTLARSLRSSPTRQEVANPFVRRDDQTIYSTEKKKEIVRQFEERLRSIVQLARDNDVAVLLATIPCNLRDWRPEQSAFVNTGDAKQDVAWRLAFRHGTESLKANDFQAAITSLEEALQIAPMHAETSFWLGRAYEGAERWEDARKAYRLACDLDATPIRRLSSTNRAVKSVAEEQNTLLVDVDHLFEEESEHGLVGLNLIEDYVHPTRQGHEIIARQFWKALDDAGQFGKTGKYNRETFDAIVSRRAEVVPEESASWFFNQGFVLQKQGHTARAIERYQQALQLDSTYPAVHANLASCLVTVGQVDQAIEHLEKVLELDPEAISARNDLAVALISVGRIDEALQQYRDALEIAPKSSFLRVNFGYVLRSVNMNDEAAAQFREALKIDSRVEKAYLGLGVLAQSAGDLRSAVSYYRQALEIKPDLLEAALNMAWIQATSSDPTLRDGSEAVQLATMAAELTGQTNPSVLDVLAAAHAEAGQFAQAVEVANRAILLIGAAETPQAQGIQQRLNLYESGKPFHQG